MPKFSIIVPCYSEVGTNHHRSGKVARLVNSVLMQSYGDFELILIDDGSPDPMLLPALRDFEFDSRVQILEQPNQQRAVARNSGMNAATGEWIIWADSDDKFLLDALWVANEAIQQYPDYKVFFFGAILKWPTGIDVRHVFAPAEEGEGHEWFRSGHINTGSFVFKRELIDDPDNRIPNAQSPYQFAADSKFDMRFTKDEPYVEEPEGAFTDGKMRVGLSLGNPWGDDFLQVYLLTRKHQAKSIDIPIYIIYPRGSEEEA